MIQAPRSHLAMAMTPVPLATGQWLGTVFSKSSLLPGAGYGRRQAPDDISVARILLVLTAQTHPPDVAPAVAARCAGLL